MTWHSSENMVAVGKKMKMKHTQTEPQQAENE